MRFHHPKHDNYPLILNLLGQYTFLPTVWYLNCWCAWFGLWNEEKTNDNFVSRSLARNASVTQIDHSFHLHRDLDIGLQRKEQLTLIFLVGNRNWIEFPNYQEEWKNSLLETDTNGPVLLGCVVQKKEMNIFMSIIWKNRKIDSFRIFSSLWVVKRVFSWLYHFVHSCTLWWNWIKINYGHWWRQMKPLRKIIKISQRETMKYISNCWWTTKQKSKEIVMNESKHRNKS